MPYCNPPSTCGETASPSYLFAILWCWACSLVAPHQFFFFAFGRIRSLHSADHIAFCYLKICFSCVSIVFSCSILSHLQGLVLCFIMWNFFLQYRVFSPKTSPQSGLSPFTCLSWSALPGAEAATGIAFRTLRHASLRITAEWRYHQGRKNSVKYNWKKYVRMFNKNIYISLVVQEHAV